MKSQGIILRLIDVVLILLIGFVSIADLSEKSRISFPFTQKAAQEQSEEQQRAIVSIIVTASADNVRLERRERIDASGASHQFDVEVYNAEYLINWRRGDAEENRTATNAAELKQQLRELISQYGNNIEAVNVIPTPSSPVNGTVDIYDIARQLELPFPGVDLSGDSQTEDAASAGE